jgi:LysR family transcriptional regulator, hydrogen peroxide-inducible genes activator
MQFKCIQYFIMIVKEGSFSSAAEKLHISQPALSQRIKKIEEELNANLFDRSKHRAELTEAGRILYLKGIHILHLYEQITNRISAIGNSSMEVVRFGISPFYSHYYLPVLLPPLLEQHPTLRYEIVEDISITLEEKLLGGNLDFCLVPVFPKNKLLEYEIVYREEILLAVPKNSPVNAYSTPASGFPYMDLSCVKNERFIALKPIQKFSESGIHLCEEFGFTPNVVCETMNWDTLNMLVSTGLGVGFVPNLLTNVISEDKRPNYYRISNNALRAYAIASIPGCTMSVASQIVINSFKNSFRKLKRDVT